MVKVESKALKPGQKFTTPTRGFGDRVFYESLLRQRPDSAMAQEWCVHYGVLPEDEAERLWKKVVKRKGDKRAGISAPSPVKKKKKVKARVLKEEAHHVGSSGGDGIGRASL